MIEACLLQMYTLCSEPIWGGLCVRLGLCETPPPCAAAEVIMETERSGSWHIAASDIFPLKDSLLKDVLGFLKGEERDDEHRFRKRELGSKGGALAHNWRERTG